LKSSDYPSLYIASDKAAINAEKKYFRIVLLKISTLLAISGLSAFSWSEITDLRLGVAAIVVILLVLGLIVDSIVLGKRYDRIWFDCRSIAETVKAQMWFYVTRTSSSDKDQDVSDSEFRRSLLDILKIERNVPQEISDNISDDSMGVTQITDYMRKMRASTLVERIHRYSVDRIQAQLAWYSAKSRWNRSREFWWYVASIALQVGAALLATALIFTGPIQIEIPELHSVTLNPIGILTTLVAGSLAWSQSRRFGELAKSYSLVSTSLSIQADRVKGIDNEQELQQLVLDVERTISREHEIWLLRGVRN